VREGAIAIPSSVYCWLTNLNNLRSDLRSHYASSMSGSTSIVVAAVVERREVGFHLAPDTRSTVENGVHLLEDSIIIP